MVIKYIQYILHYFTLVSWLTSIITFFLGAFIGHKFALNRDRRKEFNEVSEPLIAYFERVIHELESDLTYSTAQMPVESIDKTMRRLSSKERKSFENKLQRFILLRTNQEHKDQLLKLTHEMVKVIDLR